MSLAALPASSRTSAAKPQDNDSFVFCLGVTSMATISRQRMNVCVCVCNSVYSVYTGKGSSQCKHKHKHKRSCVSPSRAEPTIVGTLHTPPSLADAKRWRRRGILGYAAFAATGVEGNDVFRPGSLGELANFSSELSIL